MSLKEDFKKILHDPKISQEAKLFVESGRKKSIENLNKVYR
jgi:hypothetical protein